MTEKLEDLKAKIAELEEALSSEQAKPKDALLPDRFEGLDPEAEINVVATGRGTSPAGLVEEGTAMTITVGAFSSVWMKPAKPADAKLVNPWMKAKELAAEDQRMAREKRLDALAILKG